ncbi:hypothetical protein [Streptomyces avermitilis]|uniref:hypothetical protein n=1 Tax=Streptomyces avermitilis TaxID=33903 RepID=UPI0033BC6424
MTTSSLSRRAGAARTGAAAALAVLAAATTASIGAPVAFAAPGDEGELRIHRVGAPLGVPKDDSKVCRFYLDATNFDGAATVTYTIEAQPPLPNTATLTGTIILAAGVGRTEPLALPDGQYKLTWPVPPSTTAPQKEKIFRVDCREENEHGEKEYNGDKESNGASGPQGGGYQGGDSQGGGGQGGGDSSSQGGGNEGQGGGNGGSQGGEQDGPKGGVRAGGGGLAEMTEAVSPVAATAAVGLVVAGGVTYFRLIRRRPHGVA